MAYVHILCSHLIDKDCERDWGLFNPPLSSSTIFKQYLSRKHCLWMHSELLWWMWPGALSLLLPFLWYPPPSRWPLRSPMRDSNRRTPSLRYHSGSREGKSIHGTPVIEQHHWLDDHQYKHEAAYSPDAGVQGLQVCRGCRCTREVAWYTTVSANQKKLPLSFFGNPLPFLTQTF